MINIFVTYRCMLDCSYCFAGGLQQEFPQDLQQEDFARLLAWMESSQVAAAAFLGGEPTLHPQLVEMVRKTKERGISVTLFTNGLFADRLAQELVPQVDNFVVNYNELAESGRQSQRQRLHRTLELLAAAGSRLTFSRNFAPGGGDYRGLLAAAGRYGVKAIRYDLARPSQTGGNDFCAPADLRRTMRRIVEFVKDCEQLGIKTGLDCCLRYCDLEPEERAFLERVSMKLRGVCHPSIDIHPDLSASYCLPLRQVAVPDVTAFPSMARLSGHFADLVRARRYTAVSAECHHCDDFRRRCQGGCLATRTMGDDRTGSPFPRQLLEVAHG